MHFQERPFTRAAGNLKKAEKEAASLPPRPATSMVTEGDVIVFKGKRKCNQVKSCCKPSSIREHFIFAIFTRTIVLRI